MLSATNHKSTQVVEQMLKRPKECPHQQKTAVLYKLGISGNIPTDSILAVRITNLVAPSNIHRKPEPPSLPAPTPSLLSFYNIMWWCAWKWSHAPLLLSLCNIMWWSAWKWSQGTVVVQSIAGSLTQKSGKSPVFRNFKLHEDQDEHCNCSRHAAHIHVLHPRISHASPLRMSRMSQQTYIPT